DSAPDAILTADGGGRIVAVNPAAGRLFGYEAHDLVGKDLVMLMPERYRARHKRGLGRQRAKASQPLSGRPIELDGRRADGTEVPIELTISATESEGEILYIGIIRDISERKRAEAELRTS